MGGLVEGDKLFWVDTFVNAALGEIDFIELNCNHFLPRLVDTDLAPWSHWPIEFGYRGNRGFALWMMDLYYRILNSGIELPLSAGSANGVKATPVGYNRVYVRPGGSTIDYAAFTDALKQDGASRRTARSSSFDVDGALRAGRPGRRRSRDSRSGSAPERDRAASSRACSSSSTAGRRRTEGAGGAGAAARDDRASRSQRLGGRPCLRALGTERGLRAHEPDLLRLAGKPVVVPESVATCCRRSTCSSRTPSASRGSGRKAIARRRSTCTARRATC